MRRTRRFAGSLAAVAALGLTGVGLTALPSTAAPGPEDDVEVNVLGINDFHGRLEADGQSAGAAVLAGAVDAIRAEHPNTVFGAAGDLIGASTFVSFVDDDNPTIDALNEAGLDVSAVGNHEFDKGYDDLVNRVQDRAEWEYLGANVKVNDGSLPDLAETWTQEFEGVTVGFVGVVTEHLTELVSPSGIAMLDVLDPTQAANDAAADLKSDGADVVVLLVHEGAATTDISSATDPDTDFGAIVTGVSADVDAIVSGHTHLAYNHSVEVPEWVDEGRVVTERPVVSAGQYGYNLNQLTFTVDPDDEGVQTVTSEIVPLTEEDADGNWTPLFPADDATQAIVDDAVANAEVLGSERLGDITADFNRARQANGDENRGGESTLGNFVADVQLAAAQTTDTDAEIAFMNPGGLRTDMTYTSTGQNDPDGNVTLREAAEVQPFANTLVTTTLTGEQIIGVLEEQWQPEGASRPFLKLGVSAGLTYTYDPAAAAGSHVTSVTFDGAPLDPAAEYRVVANSFLASGGDNFATLAAGADVRDTGQIDLESMVSYLGALDEAGEAASPDLAQRAVGLTWGTDPAAVYAAGDEISFELSSLLFSAGEPVDQSLTLSLAGQQLGQFEIDPAVVDTTDEVGRASVTATIPDLAAAGITADVATPQELVIALAETGTEVVVSITVEVDEPGDDTGNETGDDTGNDTGNDTGDDTGTDAGGDEAGDDSGTDAGDAAGTDSGDDSGTAAGDADGTDDGDDDLPDTGANIMGWVIGAIAVLVVGGGLYALSRRRGAGSGGSGDEPPAPTA